MIDKKLILEKYTDLQIAELDHDLIGMFKACIEWMRVVIKQMPDLNYNLPDYPYAGYIKLHPHLPKPKDRIFIRKLAGHLFQRSDITLEERFLEIYKTIITIMYVFHFPVDILLEYSKNDIVITRELAKDILLQDGMSKNWIKEPSGYDFSKVLYR